MVDVDVLVFRFVLDVFGLVVSVIIITGLFHKLIVDVLFYD